VRPWALPGTPGLEHRIGGLEKQDVTGNVSYDPANHERMTHLRQAKIDAIQRDIPPAVVEGDADAELVVVGWGSTWGAISGGIDRVRARGRKVARIHLRHLNPLPPNLGELLAGFERFLVPEMNLGQLSKVLRAEFLVDAKTVSKVRGMPFTASEIEVAILGALDPHDAEVLQ
jgi:2-oxoglutarate ferredoxin oxidoreductase subunit alpha